MKAILLSALLLQGSSSAGPEEGWIPLDGVAAIVNDEIITFGEMTPILERLREETSVTTPQELARLRNQALAEAIDERLTTQAGRSLGLDEQLLERQIHDSMRRHRRDRGSTGFMDYLREQGLEDAQDYRDDIRERLYRDQWRTSVLGVSSGANPRPSQDRFLRPGLLVPLYRQNQDFLGEPDQVVLQELSILGPAVGGPEAARALIEDLRGRLVAGADFRRLVEEYGGTRRDTGGLGPAVPVSRIVLPELKAFAETADPGELSPILPLDAEGRDGFILFRLVEREEGTAPPPLLDGEVQFFLRQQATRERDLRRRNQARNELRRQAWLWTTP